MNPLEIFGGMGEPSQYIDQAVQLQQQGKRPFRPYQVAGGMQLPGYMHTINQLTRHPTELEDNIMSGYQESPYATYQQQNLTQQMNRAAAAGGQLGSPDEQVELARQQQGIISRDQQQYYEDAMKPFSMGLQGQSHLVGMGLQASGDVARQTDLQAAQRAAEAALAAKEKEAEASAIGSLIGMGGELVAGLI